MSESSFKDGEVVWVKWRSTWWPGEVWNSSRVPKEVLTSLRKPVQIFVHFLHEEAFEYVRNLDNIEKYNCERKMEYIKKGMEKFKSNKRVMTNFPLDVQRAEELTKGNVDILKSFDTPVKPKPAPATSATSSPATASPTMKILETPVVSKKQLGQYNSAEKVQTCSSPAAKLDSKKFTCTMCHFATDRMNLLMFHIKNHSSTFVTKVHDPPSSVSKKSFTKSPTKKSVTEDTIADDVRKIKESMKSEEKKPGRKARDTRDSSTSSPTPAAAAPTTSTGRGRWPRNKTTTTTPVVEADKRKKAVVEVKVETPPPVVNTLKNEILADWSDEDDDEDLNFAKKKVDVKEETADKKPEPTRPVTAATPSPSPANDSSSNNNRSSRSIRNIPKKQQRVSEVYVKPEPAASSSVKNEQNDADELDPKPMKSEDEEMEVTSRRERVNNRRRQQSSNNQQVQNSTAAADVEDAKQPESTDDLHLLATADELLNETEVPKVDDAPRQQSSTFHNKSNDIEKRNLPPKERNKRALRDAESSSPNNGKDDSSASAHIIISEMKLPHKKKQSSRLISNDNKPSSVEVQQTPRRKRKSDVDVIVSQAASTDDVEMVLESREKSPLREESPEEPQEQQQQQEIVTTSPRRGQKRRNTDNNDDSSPQPNNNEPKPKRIHTVDEEEGGNGDAMVMQADEEPITPVKDTESPSKLINKIPKSALKLPAERVDELKKQGLVTVGADNKNKLTEMGKQIYKEIELREKEKFEKTVSVEHEEEEEEEEQQVAVEIAAAAPNNSQEVVEQATSTQDDEMKPSSPVATHNDSQNISTNSTDSPQCDEDVEMVEEPIATKQNDVDLTEDAALEDEAQPPPTVKQAEVEQEEVANDVENVNNNDDKLDDKIANDSEVDSQETDEANEQPPEDVDESLNNNTNVIMEEEKAASKENISLPSEPLQHDIVDEMDSTPVENGKEAECDTNEDDANADGAGLIALQAESFGGPPNCFYLCRTVDNRYVPVNNQILVLNAQNALVPYEGDTDDTISQTEVVNESISILPQLSPNSNIIISTPNGQKIELNAATIVTLQQQADENGIASLDVSGEQVELNINEILEALSVNQESSEMMIVDNETAAALVLESADLQLEANTTATVVSETLSKPIMSATVAPELATVKTAIADSVASKSLEDSLAAIGVTTPHRANVPKSLELPITVTNSTIAETVNHRKLANATAIIGDVPADESVLLTAATVAVVVDDNEAAE